MTKDTVKRIWELDFLRGIALLLMVYFHTIYDLKEVFNVNIIYEKGFNHYTGRIAAVLFILIAGISCSFSKGNVKRGLRVLGVAMVITIVTHIAGPSFAINFGILHFLGISMILYPLFARLNKVELIVVGAIIIAVGNYISRTTVPQEFLFPLGLYSKTFYSSDYYPLFPWFGLFLFGVALSKILYSNRKSLFKVSIPNNPVNFVGRHTLIVYVIHQPIIFAILWLIFKK